MRTLRQAAILFLLLTVLTGIIYPLLVTGLAQLAFPTQANGSVVKRDGKTVGSRLIGQNFTNAGYFHGRASPVDCQADSSGGYNFGPGNTHFIVLVSNRLAAVRSENGLAKDFPVPADMVLASASGLDPDISVANAMLQADRIARARKVSVRSIQEIIGRNKEKPWFGFIGEERVNVLKLNLALDGEYGYQRGDGK